MFGKAKVVWYQGKLRVNKGGHIKPSIVAKYVTVWRGWWTQPNNFDCGIYTIFALVYLIQNDLLERLFEEQFIVPKQADNFSWQARLHIWVVLHQKFGGVGKIQRLPPQEDGDLEITSSKINTRFDEANVIAVDRKGKGKEVVYRGTNTVNDLEQRGQPSHYDMAAQFLSDAPDAYELVESDVEMS